MQRSERPADMAFMALFTWIPRYETGIPEIDVDHKRLFGTAEALHTSLAQGMGRDILRDRLAALVDESRAHFAREERLIVDSGYPEAESHRQEHQRLTEEALRIQREFLKSRAGVTAEMLRFLKGWLCTHIEAADRRLAEHLHSVRSGAV